MKTKPSNILLVLAAGALLGVGTSKAAVQPEEAAKLHTILTPLGAERAGNEEGSIPSWTGELTPNAGIVDGRRQDPFAAEKPLYSVNIDNMEQYEDKLSEGTKELMRRYPDTFRIDVYPSHRTAIAPQWVYENTAKNAVNAKLVDGDAGPMPQGAYGGTPFPIPSSGAEAMWNHKLYWRGTSYGVTSKGYQLTQDGQWINVLVAAGEFQMPYHLKDGQDKFNGEYYWAATRTQGPPIRAGEALTARLSFDESDSQAWVYLTGQRRVRRLPNSCCDTPSPMSAGVSYFDEVNTFNGRMDRFDWELVGKQEMLIPYNTNRTLTPTKNSEILGDRHLNPDHIRWELHRVWVVEATLKDGQRHAVARSRYYLDEDTWGAVLGDRYDANGQLSRKVMSLPVLMSDFPAVVLTSWALYDFNVGNMFVINLPNEDDRPFVPLEPMRSSHFTPDAMSGSSIR